MARLPATPVPLEELMAGQQARTDALAAIDASPAQYAGKTEEQEAQLAEDLRRVEQPPGGVIARLEAANAALAEQLKRTQEMVEKLARANGVGSVAEAAAVELDSIEVERARRTVYDQVRQRGNRCRITLHTHADPNQNHPVLIKAGRQQMRRLPRGVPIEVTAEELEVLDHAEIDAWVDDFDAGTNKKIKRRVKGTTYPYTLHDPGLLLTQALR